ncbi:hypothetical protein [Sphingobacterium siyangense]|jgi:sulfur relay (sulfurtransferase) DsrC/TusE family protein
MGGTGNPGRIVTGGAPLDLQGTKPVFIKNWWKWSFAVFLYAYLNQIDLSLDRSRWEPLDNLRDFYRSQISPKKVANYLIDKFGLNIEKLNYLIFIDEESLWEKIKDSLLSGLGGNLARLKSIMP